MSHLFEIISESDKEYVQFKKSFVDYETKKESFKKSLKQLTGLFTYKLFFSFTFELFFKISNFVRLYTIS